MNVRTTYQTPINPHSPLRRLTRRYVLTIYITRAIACLELDQKA